MGTTRIKETKGGKQMNTQELIKALDNVTTYCYAELTDKTVTVWSTYCDEDEHEIIFSIPTYAASIHSVHTQSDALYGLTISDLTDIGNIIQRYFDTPLKKRLEETRYYLKTASPLVIEETKYLNYNLKTDSYFYSTVYNDEDHIKYIFTQTEVDNMDTTRLIPEPITDSEEEN